MGNTSVKAPAPSAAEQKLQAMQLKLLKEQTAEDKQLKPYLYEAMGLRVNAEGKLEEIPEADRLAAMTPQERMQYDLATAYMKRQQDALSGNLPVSPAMEAELAQQQADMEENLSRRLGKDWKLSTSGIQSTDEFNKRAGLLREEARRGQISTGEGLIASRMGLTGQQQGQQYNQMQNWGAPAMGLMNAYSQAYQPYQFNRQMAYDAKAQSAANKMGLISGGMELAGMLGGSVITKYCWVAEVLFGIDHEKTHNARRYATFTDNWLTCLYRKHGKAWAKWLTKHSWAKPIVRPIWEYMAYKGNAMREVGYAVKNTVA